MIHFSVFLSEAFQLIIVEKRKIQINYPVAAI